MHTLVDSHYRPKRSVSCVGKLNDDHEISTTWVFNRDLRKKALQRCRDVAREYCISHDLNCVTIDDRHINITGNAKQHTKAFGVNLEKYQDGDHIFHGTTEPIKIPEELKDQVENVLGFNTHKIARPYVWSASLKPRGSTTFTPLQLATLYNFPTNLNGSGQRVGIIELGGGYVLSDITTYFSMLGIKATPNITDVSVDGAVNNPSDTSGANVEVILDIEVVAALVPNASIFVYFAPNTLQGFYDAINAAINNNCGVISISWGAAEVYWGSAMTTFNNLFSVASTKNITILAASGDNGSSDGTTGNNVDFPASSPYVLGCGGTSLSTSDNVTISSETVWSNTGGGISNYFTVPSYQSGLNMLNGYRGVPDISGDGNPSTGYILYSASNGGTIVVGGTSAVSPLWSALFARINQSLGRNIGFVHPILYNNLSTLRDVTQGSNGAYSAGLGWDACSGCGSPNGQALLNLLNTSSPVASFSGTPLSGTNSLTVNFTDSSTNAPTSWLWNFGDNTTSTNQNSKHTYASPGSYTVSLTVTNANGSNTLTKTNYINIKQSSAPVASFTGAPTTGIGSVSVQFKDTSTNNPIKWSWYFGDGRTGTAQNPVHNYTKKGAYTVQLTATNSSGSSVVTKDNFINVT